MDLSELFVYSLKDLASLLLLRLRQAGSQVWDPFLARQEGFLHQALAGLAQAGQLAAPVHWRFLTGNQA